MKRSGFKRQQIERQPVVVVPIPAEMRARINFGPSANEAASVFKVKTVQHEGYRAAVASLCCIHCKWPGPSQCAHPNTGKAMGKKLIDDRLCFPLCADFPGRRGCHSQFDQGAMFTKELRHEIEPAWGQQTRAMVRAKGLWPAGLADWPGDVSGASSTEPQAVPLE